MVWDRIERRTNSRPAVSTSLTRPAKTSAQVAPSGVLVSTSMYRLSQQIRTDLGHPGVVEEPHLIPIRSSRL